MTRILSGLPLFLALSAVQAQVGHEPPADESNLVGTIIFIILFVGACAGFAWFVWKNEQKAKNRQGGGSGPKA